MQLLAKISLVVALALISSLLCSADQSLDSPAPLWVTFKDAKQSYYGPAYFVTALLALDCNPTSIRPFQYECVTASSDPSKFIGVNYKTQCSSCTECAHTVFYEFATSHFFGCSHNPREFFADNYEQGGVETRQWNTNDCSDVTGLTVGTAWKGLYSLKIHSCFPPKFYSETTSYGHTICDAQGAKLTKGYNTTNDPECKAPSYSPSWDLPSPTGPFGFNFDYTCDQVNTTATPTEQAVCIPAGTAVPTFTPPPNSAPLLASIGIVTSLAVVLLAMLLA